MFIETHFDFWNEEQKIFVKNQLQKMFDNSEYHMAVHENTIPHILESGRIKSIMEVDENDIMVSARKKITEKAFGCDTNQLVSRDYEKYGYLGHQDFVKDAKEATAVDSDSYGSVIFRFNKESLRNRVTYTYNDSYGIVLADECIAGNDGDNVSITGINSYQRTANDILSKFMTASSQDLNNPNRMAHSFGGSYIELQYHGDLKVEDIVSVCFTKEVYDRGLAEQFKGKGIEVYHIQDEKAVRI